MKVYALRHKATGLFMPTKMSRGSGRGWSWWSPGAAGDDPYDKNPRLFFTRKGADNSRVLWARGPVKRHVGSAYSYLEWPEYYDENEVVAPPVPRHKDDLEVVVYELKALLA